MPTDDTDTTVMVMETDGAAAACWFGKQTPYPYP